MTFQDPKKRAKLDKKPFPYPGGGEDSPNSNNRINSNTRHTNTSVEHHTPHNTNTTVRITLALFVNRQ